MIMDIKKKILVFTLLFPFFSISQNWIQESPFPYAGVHHPITFSYEQYAFVVSGSNTDNVYKYDKINDTWVELSPFPGGERGYAYGLVVGSKAYMGFGSDPNSNFPTDWWEYDIINDSWQQKSSFPDNGRNHPAMVSVGDKIYMGCGSNTANLGDWYEYDIINDQWTRKTDIIGNDRHHPFYFSIGNYAYVGFGHGSSIGPGSNPSASSYIYNDFYRYDPANDSWTQLSDFPSEARVAGTQFSYGDYGYVLSGDGDDHGPLDNGELWQYDPINDSWNQLPSHPGDAIWAPGNFIIDCSVYFLLGQNNNTIPSTYPSNIYSYKLSFDCGCTDPIAYNFSNLAIYDDGSCCYVTGCTDPYAINYDSLACFDDASCILPVLGCTNSTASNFNPNANIMTAFGGELDNMFSTGSYFQGNQHLVFDASIDCNIKSAIFYSDINNNQVTFELRNANGTVVDDTTHVLDSGSQRLELNFNVPIGNNYQLGISSNNSSLYRNNSGAQYPYNIGGAIDITGSSASSSSYYYFYYNIEVETECLNVSAINQFSFLKNKEIISVFDIFGKETSISTGKVLFFLLDDGKVEKKIFFD